MNFKRLAEAIGRQLVLLHIDGIGIREMRIIELINLYRFLVEAPPEFNDFSMERLIEDIITEPSNQFQSGELANLN